MKKTLLLLVLLCSLSLSAMAQTKWVDATTLNICGHTIRNAKNPYSRLETKPYGFTNKAIIRYSQYSTGLYVMFKTNSSQISAEWTVKSVKIRDNMTPIVQLGVDLYVKQNGKWQFCSVGRVSTNPEVKTYNKPLIKHMDRSEKEFMLYLPLWSEVTELKIGVDEDATIEAIPSPYKHRVVSYGTSTLHAASPSRPGMAPLARLSRQLGVDFVNFSYSGQGKMEPESADVLTECQTDAIICYCFGNTKAHEVEERVDGFVAQLVKAHPDKAIIFMPPYLNGEYSLNLQKRKSVLEKRAVINRKMKALDKKYKNVYFLNIKDSCGTDLEASIDNSHPNDLGFDRILQSYGPQIAKILKKHGIEVSNMQR